MRAVELERVDHLVGVVFTRELGFEAELRVVKLDAFKLHDAVGDFFGPIAAHGLDHADRETVQADVKHMAAGPLEPGRQPAVVVVLFQQADAIALGRHHVGASHARKAGSDDNHVVFGLGFINGVHLLLQTPARRAA